MRRAFAHLQLLACGSHPIGLAQRGEMGADVSLRAAASCAISFVLFRLRQGGSKAARACAVRSARAETGDAAGRAGAGCGSGGDRVN